jgi:hypothetical protein
MCVISKWLKFGVIKQNDGISYKFERNWIWKQKKTHLEIAIKN